MAIYMDANALWSWRTFTEVDRLAVSIVARQLGQQVFIPWIAAREVEEEYRRSLEDATDSLNRAHETLERRFNMEFELDLEPWPDIEDQVMVWRRHLDELALRLPLHDDDARTAFEREITGAPPAAPRVPRKAGRGGRDAAIWLTIARHHTEAKEQGHLLSADKVFSDGDGGLNKTLRADLGDGAHDMRVYRDLATFLARLGKTVSGRTLTLDDLRVLAIDALKNELEFSLEIPIAVWGELAPDLRYSTGISEARPVELLEQRRYEQGDDAVIVVNARWHLVVECRYQNRDTDTPRLWTTIKDVAVEGDVQLFLEERSKVLQPAEFIGARITSDASLHFVPDGTVFSMQSVRE
jgi:PIN domain